jgi:hypothetical protein
MRIVLAPWSLFRLRIDYSRNMMSNDERMQRESSLIATIRKKLPEFAKACADDTEVVLLHQDAFAADYQEDEYMLLGMWHCKFGPVHDVFRGSNKTPS